MSVPISKISKGILCPFFILLLTCCTEQKNIRIAEQFPLDFDLKANGIDSLNHYPGTYSIAMAGDKYIGKRKAEHFFFILDEDFSLISEIAAKGHGNGEFMAPLYCGQYAEENGKEYVYILERPERKLYKVALRGNERNECIFEIPLSWNVEPSFFCLHGPDSCLGINNLHNCNFFIANLSQHKAEEQPPLQDFSGTEKEVLNMAQSIASYSAGKSRVAMAYFNLPEIDIRASNGHLIQSVFYKDIMKPSEIDQYDPHMYFADITSTDRHIYALYTGDEKVQQAGKSLVLVFDWDGNPVCRMKIDASVSIAVDTERRQIVSVNEDDSHYVASMYKLPEALQ